MRENIDVATFLPFSLFGVKRFVWLVSCLPFLFLVMDTIICFILITSVNYVPKNCFFT